MPAWGLRLADIGPWAAKQAGLVVKQGLEPGEESLVLDGGTMLLPQALGQAMKEGRAQDGDLSFRLGGRLGALLAEVSPGSGGGLAYLAPGGAGTLEQRLAAAEVVEMDPCERLVSMGPGGLEVPVSDHLFLPIRHWVHLLWGNLLGLGPRIWHQSVGSHPAWALLRLSWAALRSGSTRPEKIAARCVYRGKGSRIHPSAVVEGSVLLPGATVEAQAVVRGSILGPGSVVEALALCEGCVLGEAAVVQRQGMLKFSVLGDGAMVGGVTQLSVLGAGSSLKSGAYGMDQSLEGDVRIRTPEGLVPAPMGMAGLCLGAGARVGSGVWVAPGREVPAGAVLVKADPWRGETP
jgi:hypothetical protein